MINWAIGLIIFAFAGWMLYKNIKKASAGKCPSCSGGCNCGGGENCRCHS